MPLKHGITNSPYKLQNFTIQIRTFDTFSVYILWRLYVQVNYPSAKASRLVTLLGYDWLVDIPLPEEGDHSLSLSGNAPQPDFSRGIEVCVPSSHEDHAAETDMFFRTVQINCLTPQGSAFPSQGWTLIECKTIH